MFLAIAAKVSTVSQVQAMSNILMDVLKNIFVFSSDLIEPQQLYQVKFLGFVNFITFINFKCRHRESNRQKMMY